MNSNLQPSKLSGNGSDNAAGASSREAYNEAREKLMNDMKNVIGEAESWLDGAAAHSGDDLKAVREKFETALHTAKTDLLRIEANMLAKTKLAAQATDTYVKDNPWKSVGFGAAVGIALGLLIARK